VKAAGCQLALCIALSCLLASGLQARIKAYRWTDAQGKTQYGDQPPAGVKATPIKVPEPEPQGPAELLIERKGSTMSLVANNPMHGPVEILLRAIELDNAISTPVLPLRRVLAGNRRSPLAQVSLLEGQQSARIGFVLESVPGDPLAEPRDVAYSLPVDSSSHWQLGQGFHGGFSHADAANRYAIDLIVPEGTPVLAARDGIVMQAEAGFDRGGADKDRYYERANLLRILHDDGSMAIYAHLRENGALVRAGESVGLGQVIGISGNTGFTSGPHLHFCVQVNRGLRLESIPFRMVGPNGYLPMGSR